MAELQYFGEYARFETADKKQASSLLGADDLVGDFFTVQMRQENNDARAWLVNKFDKDIGYLSRKTTEDLQLCQAKGWDVYAILALVCFTDNPEPGYFWGEVVLVSFPPHKVEMKSWLLSLSKAVADGTRVDVALSAEGLQKIEETNGLWLPSARVDKPKMEKGTAVCKDHRSFSEKMIELARARNMGCMIGGWVFLLAIVAVIVFALRGCVGF